MPDLYTALGWIGRGVDDVQGARLGTVEDVFVDLGTPRWLVVRPRGSRRPELALPVEAVAEDGDGRLTVRRGLSPAGRRGRLSARSTTSRLEEEMLEGTDGEAAAELPIEGELPDFGGATAWLNSEPLTPAGLRGKVVLVQFCTYSCVSWLRTLPEEAAQHSGFSGADGRDGTKVETGPLRITGRPAAPGPDARPSGPDRRGPDGYRNRVFRADLDSSEEGSVHKPARQRRARFVRLGRSAWWSAARKPLPQNSIAGMLGPFSRRIQGRYQQQLPTWTQRTDSFDRDHLEMRKAVTSTGWDYSSSSEPATSREFPDFRPRGTRFCSTA